MIDWWELDIDRDKAEAAFDKAGLRFSGWVNRIPKCEGKTEEELLSILSAFTGDSPGGGSPKPTKRHRKR